jgi:serine phosphatase RsbU (regulator of sigma subunit)
VISTIKTRVNLSVFQLNTNTNRLQISSYGSLNTMYYTRSRSGILPLNSTEIGTELSRKAGLRDISLVLDPGDAILYYSRGVTGASVDNKRRFYDETMLTGQLLKEINNSPMEICHSIIESLYAFVNFQSLIEDITLFCLKRTD